MLLADLAGRTSGFALPASTGISARALYSHASSALLTVTSNPTFPLSATMPSTSNSGLESTMLSAIKSSIPGSVQMTSGLFSMNVPPVSDFFLLYHMRHKKQGSRKRCPVGRAERLLILAVVDAEHCARRGLDEMVYRCTGGLDGGGELRNVLCRPVEREKDG